MADFKINDTVIHLRDGLSKIVSTKTIETNDYFIVESCHNNGETIYVPIARADLIIRHPLSKEEMTALIKSLKGIEKEFNSNTKQRRDAFKRMLGSGKIEDIAYMYRQYKLYLSNSEDVKLGNADVDMLEYAKNFLLDEVSVVFDIARESADEFVTKLIG